MTLNNTTKFSCTKNDEYFVLMVLYIVGGWLSVITCILGLLANTFSIIILANKRMRKLSTNIYLIALATVNLLWLILLFIFYAFRLSIILPYFIFENDENFYSIYNQIFHRLSPYIIPLMNTLQICIIYYTVAVSIDRYLYVLMSLQTNLYCTVRNALRIITCLTIFAIIFIIPYWFTFHVTKRIDTENRTRYRMMYTDISQQKLFREIVNIYVYIPMVHVIPFITLIFINILTIRCLIKYRDVHRRLLPTSARQITMIKTNIIYSRRHHHVTIMLIGVVLLFLICRFPMLINKIYEARDLMNNNYLSKDNQYFHCRIQRVFNTFVSFLQTINSNGNLIMYLACCQNFRDISKELFEKLLNFIRFRINENILTMMHVRSRTSTTTHSTDI